MKKYSILLLFAYFNLFAKDLDTDYFEMLKYSEQLTNESDSVKTAENNWLRRYLWNTRMDFGTDGRFNFSEATSEQYSQLGKENNPNILSENSWVPVGPILIPPTYVPRSCYAMGRVNCIEFHPTDKNVFWIGTPGGGIWKTEDYGQNWMPLLDDMPSMAISHIAVNPKNPDILYAATGDFDISGMTSGNTSGIIKSTDGGMSWTVTPFLNEPTFGQSSLRKIIIHPDSTNHLIVAGRKGIWKSVDEGDSWRRVSDSIFSDLEMNPSNPQVLYAAMSQLYGTGSAGVMRSYDFGETWEVLSTGIPPKGEISRVDLAISPADTNYVYVLNVKSNTNGFHSFFCSTNGGNDWKMNSKLDTNNNIIGAWGGDASDRNGQGSYDLVLLPDADDKERVYTGGINIWMSENSGIDWEMASFWIYVFGESTHADHHYAAYNKLDKKYYWCNDGGVYRTDSINPGSKTWVTDWIDTYNENLKEGAPSVEFPTKWENLNDGLVITEFYRMSLSKNNDNVLAGGSQDNSCYYYNTGNWLNYIPNYDGMETMIDHDNTDIFYGVWQNGGLCKTTDGGKTIETRLSKSINEKGNWITPVGMDPEDSEHIYMGYRNLWESFDGGYNWVKLLDFDAFDSTHKNRSSLTIVKTSHKGSYHISCYKGASYYQDTSKAWVRVPGELWITRNRGITWHKSTIGLPIDTLDIVSIDYDRKDPLRMWAGIYSWYREINLYHTTDGGQTWTDISRPLPPGIRINAILHQQSNGDIIYAGTNKGVYYCDAKTEQWMPMNENLPLTIVNDLEWQESTGEIFAATYGRGIWRTNQLVDGVKEQNLTLSDIKISPNPVAGNLSIDLSGIDKLSESIFEIRIIDMRGAEVFEAERPKSNKIELNPGLPDGAYFILLRCGKSTYSGKFLVRNKK